MPPESLTGLLLLVKLVLAIATTKNPAYRAWLCRIVEAVLVGAVWGLAGFGAMVFAAILICPLTGMLFPMILLMLLVPPLGFAFGVVRHLVYHYNCVRCVKR